MKRLTMLPGILLVLALVFWPISSHSRTWHLNPSGTGDAPSIQAAFDSVSAGDTIAFSEGTYTQHAQCDSISHIILVGVSSEGVGKATIRSDWTGPILAVFWGNDVRIENLEFEESEGGLYWYSCSGIEIRNTEFRNIGRTYYHPATSFAVSWGILVEGCVFASCYEGVGTTDFNYDISIRSSTFLGNLKAGISLDASTDVTIANNLIQGNQYGIEGLPIQPLILCNDVFGNVVNYGIKDFDDPTGLNGNISQDPQFCAADPIETGNYCLQSDSPCAPLNHPQGYSCGLIGFAPVGCSTVSIRSTSWGGIKMLYR